MGIPFWRDLSIVWLSLLCFIGMIIPFGATYFAIRGMNIVLSGVRPAMHKAQGVSRVVRSQTTNVADKIADPVIRVHRTGARVDGALKGLLAKSANRRTGKEQDNERPK